MAPPSNEQAKLLRQLVLSGMVDKLAKLIQCNVYAFLNFFKFF